MLLSCMLPYYLKAKGVEPDWSVVTKICNTFRVYDDMQDSWESLHALIKYFADEGSSYVNHTGPGHWTDPGQVGNG